ncbi:MAG: hypothetical protein ABW360_13330 [Phenylobacterium sp.]
MGKHAVVLALAFLGLAGLAVLAGWAAFGLASSGGGASLGALWPYLLGAIAALAAVGGFLSWMTSYAARRRGDDGRRKP